MADMINIYLYGKKYEVPASLTIMEAFEYAGYQLVRGCGCRNGFCGACATIYRIKGKNELVGCLACSTKVENDMCVATLPFFPLEKKVYDRSSGERHGNSLQYSCLENPTDRGTWRATVHAVEQSRTRLKWLTTHAFPFLSKVLPNSLHLQAGMESRECPGRSESG